MKKIFSIAGLSLLLLIFAGFQAAAQEDGSKMDVIGGDEAGLREMLAQVLWSPYPGAAGGAVYVGELPADLPFEIPMPEDITVVGSVAYKSDEAYPRGTQIYLKTALTTPEVLAYFEENLPDSFTPVDEGFMPMPSGFQASDMPQIMMFCYNEAEGYLNINAYNEPSGTRIMLDIAGEEAARYSPCGMSSSPEGMSGAYQLMPSLTAPAGVEIRMGMGGGGGGMDSAGSGVTMISESLTAADLISYYVEEVAAAGWTVSNNAAQPEGGWLTGTIESEGETWILNLTILQDPLKPNEYSANMLVVLSR